MIRSILCRFSSASATLRLMSSCNSLNPLLAPWPGPHGGLPPFSSVKTSHFLPAITESIAAFHSDLASIASCSQEPTFANTLEAYCAAGRSLTAVESIYSTWASVMSSPDFQAVETQIEPLLAAARDAAFQNSALFSRIKTLHDDAGARATLTPEQVRLLDVTFKNFKRRGALLSDAEKPEVAAINQELSALFTQFNQNLLKSEEEVTEVQSAAELDGMDAAFIASVTRPDGSLAIPNTRSSVEPLLTCCSNRSLRERVFKLFVSRGIPVNEPIVASILRLRSRRAALLGYENHAAWVMEDTMAGNLATVDKMLTSVWQAAVKRVGEEVAEMQRIMSAEGCGDSNVQPWDYRFWNEKVRKAKYALDDGMLKPYLQLQRLRDGMFWVAQQLYGYTFHVMDDVPLYHPQTSCYEVRASDGSHVGLWYFDPYARTGKRSGAWMSEYRTQHAQENSTPIVSNNCNFTPPAPGEIALLSWDDAVTLFHEFGHALHGLSSRVTYRLLAGTATTRDHVELPSQLNEHWLQTPELLQKFACHVADGSPLPMDLVEKIEAASTFAQGFGTVEFLASAFVDLRMHCAPVGLGGLTPLEFQANVLADLQLPPQIVMRHATPHFQHVFGDDGYSSAYWSYLWADALVSDAVDAFKQAPGGMYDGETAKKFFDCILSRGNTLDPADGFRRFRGRDVDQHALLVKRGFA